MARHDSNAACFFPYSWLKLQTDLDGVLEVVVGYRRGLWIAEPYVMNGQSKVA